MPFPSRPILGPMRQPIEDPFESPLTEPIYRSRVELLRRAAGMGAFFLALYDAFIGIVSVVVLPLKLSMRHFTTTDWFRVGEIVFGCLFATGLFGAGHRLRTRSRGNIEWAVLVALLMLSVAAVNLDF